MTEFNYHHIFKAVALCVDAVIENPDGYACLTISNVCDDNGFSYFVDSFRGVISRLIDGHKTLYSYLYTQSGNSEIYGEDMREARIRLILQWQSTIVCIS